MRANGVAVDGALLKEQALKLARELGISQDSFKASQGWFERMKARHGLVSIKLHGEAGSADLLGVQSARANLPKLLEERDADGYIYTADDVFNFDESGLFWRMEPTRTFITSEVRGWRGPAGRLRLARQRLDCMKALTILMCCANAPSLLL